MSFHLESKLDSIDSLANRYPSYGLARVSVDVVRSGGKLGAQPWPTEDYPDHVVVFRIDGGSRIQKGEAKRLANILTNNWIRLPRRPDMR